MDTANANTAANYSTCATVCLKSRDAAKTCTAYHTAPTANMALQVLPVIAPYHCTIAKPQPQWPKCIACDITNHNATLRSVDWHRPLTTPLSGAANMACVCTAMRACRTWHALSMLRALKRTASKGLRLSVRGRPACVAAGTRSPGFS